MGGVGGEMLPDMDWLIAVAAGWDWESGVSALTLSGDWAHACTLSLLHYSGLNDRENMRETRVAGAGGGVGKGWDSRRGDSRASCLNVVIFASPPRSSTSDRDSASWSSFN